MDKEEILQKSRAESRDEGEEHAIRVGSNWALTGMTLMYITVIALVMALDICSVMHNGRRILENGPYSISLAPLHGMYWFGRGLAVLGKESISGHSTLSIGGIVSTAMGVIAILLYIVDLALSIGTVG